MTYEEAVEINCERSNGLVEGQHLNGVPQVNRSKGGRFWLQGEFTLEEIKALWVIGRTQMGESAKKGEFL